MNHPDDRYDQYGAPDPYGRPTRRAPAPQSFARQSFVRDPFVQNPFVTGPFDPGSFGGPLSRLRTGGAVMIAIVLAIGAGIGGYLLFLRDPETLAPAAR